MQHENEYGRLSWSFRRVLCMLVADLQSSCSISSLSKYRIIKDIIYLKLLATMGEIIDEIGIENKIFFETFLCLRITGFWRSTTMKHRCLQFCYSLFTIFSYNSIFMLIVTILVDIIVTEDKDFSNVIEYWYMIAIFCIVLTKGTNVLMKRSKIIEILQTNIIHERWINLRDDGEIELVRVSKISERNILRLWLSMLFVNGVIAALTPILNENPNNILMWECWSPCDRSVPLCFWICYFYQVFGYAMCGTMHVACDSINFNLIQRICTHIRIFQRRLQLLPDLVTKGVISTAESEHLYIKNCILDHQSIYNAAKEISNIFYATVLMHFVLSFTIMCTNIYFLSKQPLFSSTFTTTFVYLCCAMMQTLFYCWYGYKLTEINAEIPYAIFSMDWMKLRKETRKMLQFIMLPASKNITLFDNFIVELSPQMFLKLLKISYSAFNLLQARN